MDATGLIPGAVFVAGVASMGLEILAGRLLAPDFGSSVFVWGSVIGVFLAALALGYRIAGWRAGAHASPAGLATALSGAGAYVAVVIVVGDPLVAASADFPLPQRIRPVVPIAILFGPPTVLLGFVSPYGAELVDARSTGDASGRVYALGTAGSLLGAFGTTFVLVPALDVEAIEFVFGLLLLGAALAVAPRQHRRHRIVGALVAFALILSFAATSVGPLAGDAVYQTQTSYQELRVADDDEVRTLYLDGVPHSAMDLTNPTRYVFEYTRYFHLPLLFQDDVNRVLFVGGGGFSGPKRFLAEYANVTVDVVEIDPAVVRVAREYFAVPESDRLGIHVEDGRVFLADTTDTYDVIVLDAYRADRVPYHLTTVEFMELAADRLDDDGVLVANVISARRGSEAAFYRAQYRTMDRVFPRVYSFPTSETTALQNIMLVATKSPQRVSQATLDDRNDRRSIGIDLTGAISNYRATVAVGDAPLLRDDHAPVGGLLAEQLERRYVVERADGNETRVSP